MATGLRNVGRASSCLCKLNAQLTHDYQNLPRVLLNYQPSRGRRRAGGPPSWFARVKPFNVDVGLTEENKDFLQDVACDTFNINSPLRDEPWERGQYTYGTFRTGVLALKIGVVPQWTVGGRKFFTTMLQVLDNHVIRYTPPEEVRKSAGWKPWWGNKYGVVVVGALSCDPGMFSKSYNNLFTEAGVPPKRKVTRFLVTENAKVQPGTPLTAMHFKVGDFIDYQAKTIDHGFQGVVKRWGMKGMPASHGTTKSHRKMGSTGGGGDKSNIWKGKKMAGHMGDDWTTIPGIRIWRINTKHNILYVTGPCLPGATHTYVRLMDTRIPNKRRKEDNPPLMPTWFPEDNPDPLPEELFYDHLYKFSDPSIVYEEEAEK